MAKNAYIGVGGTARKIKDIYIGVNGVARKITKAYVGVGNVARLFYEAVNLGTWPKYIYFNANNGSGTPSTVTFSSQSYTTDIGSTVPTRTYYTFCGWGISSSTSSSSSYRIAYSGNEGSTTTSSSWNWEKYCEKVNQTDVTVTSITLYAVWKSSLTWPKYIYFNANGGSGSVPSTITFSSETSAYDTSSTRPTRTNYTFYGWALSPSATSSSKRVDYNGQQGATTTGTWTWTTWCEKVGQSDVTVSSITLYAVWVYSGSSGPTATTKLTDIFTESTKISSSMARTADGNYMLIAGVNTTTKVYAINTSYTKSTPTALSAARRTPMGCYNGSYALFVGGTTSSSSASNVCDAYNNSLTRSTNTSIPSTGHQNGTSGYIGNYAIFAGGSRDWTETDRVEAFNNSLTYTAPTQLSTERGGTSGVVFGNYFSVIGGHIESNYVKQSSIDQYNSSLTRSICSSTLSVAANTNSLIFSNKIVVFMDIDSGSWTKTFNTFNSSFTRTVYTHSPVSVSRQRPLMFVYDSKLYCMGNRTVTTMDVFTSSMTKSTVENSLFPNVGITANVSNHNHTWYTALGSAALWIPTYRNYANTSSSSYTIVNNLIVIQ